MKTIQKVCMPLGPKAHARAKERARENVTIVGPQDTSLESVRISQKERVKGKDFRESAAAVENLGIPPGSAPRAGEK